MNICQFNKLKKFDSELVTAVKCKCKRGFSSSELDYLIEVGKELGIYCGNRSCPNCVLTFLIALGNPYIEFKEKMEKKKNEKEKD